MLQGHELYLSRADAMLAGASALQGNGALDHPLIERFSLERVQKAGAVFNLEKLDFLNGHYIRQKTPQELAALIHSRLEETDWFKPAMMEGDFLRFLASVQLRMKTLNDAAPMLKPFLLDELDYDLSLFNNEKMKVDQAMTVLALENSIPALEALEDYSTEEAIKECLVKVIEKLGVKNGQLLWPLRVALTNEQYSPGTFELIHLMGKDLTLKRLRSALEKMR